MPEHFTKRTVSAAYYCGKCSKVTMHRVDEGRKGPCLECIDRLNTVHQLEAARKQLDSDKVPGEQARLFEDGT